MKMYKYECRHCGKSLFITSNPERTKETLCRVCHIRGKWKLVKDA